MMNYLNTFPSIETLRHFWKEVRCVFLYFFLEFSEDVALGALLLCSGGRQGLAMDTALRRYDRLFFSL